MHECSSEIISETLQTPISTLFQHFEQKNILRDISLSRLGKNVSIALQNITESQKNNKKNNNKNSKLYQNIVKLLVLD